MNHRFTCKELGAILGINPTSVSRSVEPMWDKAARLFGAKPVEFMEELVERHGRLNDARIRDYNV